MKKALKMLSRLLSVVLTVLLLLEVMPLSTLAANLDEARQQQEYTESLLNNAAEEKTPKKAEIKCEVAEQRDEYTKVYKRADGSFTKLISSSPLHYMEDGVWEEINNTLKAYNGVLKNEAGAFNVELPSVIAANKSISIENSGDEISFKMNGIESSSASVSNNIGAAESGETLADSAAAKTSSSVVYEDIAQNTDLQYIVTPEAVKENIIINNKESAAQSYSFTVNKGTLTAAADDNGNINFTDTDGTVKFTIPAPVMTDAAGAVSYDIAVTLTPANDSAVTLTYAPSSEWLASAERAYPVAVDPVITVPSDDDELFSDTFVYYDTSDSETKDRNYVNAFVGVVANTHNPDNNSDISGEILVKLNMNAFSAFKQPGIVVTDVGYVVEGTGISSNLQLKAINGAWEPSEITYNDVHPVTADPATGELPAPQITYDTAVTDYYNGSTVATGESPNYM